MMDPEPFAAVRGDGFPIVLVHGMGVDHRSLLLLDDAFPKGARRIYLDLPGYGRTSALPDPGGLPEYADWLLDAIDELVGRGRFALVGNSMGGALAREMIARVPRRVAGIAMIAPVVDPVIAHRRVAEHDVHDPNPDLMHKLPLDQVLDFIRMGVNQSYEAWRRYQMYVLPGIRAFDRDAYMKLEQRYWLADDPERVFGVFDGPTTIICGRQDQIVGYEDQEAMLPHYPNARYTVIEEAGHNVHIDRPEQVKALLGDWAARLPL